MGCTSVFCASCASEEVVLGVEAAVLPAVELEAPQPAMVIPSAKSTVNVLFYGSISYENLLSLA